MIAVFLRTELPAARFREPLTALLADAGVPERIVTEPNLDDDTENQLRRQLLTAHRGYGTDSGLFNGFPREVAWAWMGVTPAELASVCYIDYDYWVELSGGSRLAESPRSARLGLSPAP